MATYVVLARYTQQGVAEIKNTLERVRANAERAGGAGMTVKAWYMTLGDYDSVMVIDAPDDETMAAGLIMLGQQGNLRTTTMRAFGMEEAGRIVEKLP